jgi:hypothetical protein
MKKFTLGLPLLLSLSLGMVGCGDSGESGNGCPDGQIPCDGVCVDAIEPTLTSIQPGVFDISCTASACHDAAVPQAELDLSSLSASESNLIAVDSTQVPTSLRVAPFDSDASYLMNKLLGVDMAPTTTRMPQLTLDGLCQSKIDVVRQWIDDGAPVN